MRKNGNTFLISLLMLVCQLGSNLEFIVSVSGFTISSITKKGAGASTSTITFSVRDSENDNLERETLRLRRCSSTTTTTIATTKTSLQMNKRNRNDNDEEDDDDGYEYAKVRRGKRGKFANDYDDYDEYDGARGRGTTSSTSQRNDNDVDVGSKKSYRGDYEEWDDEEDWDSEDEYDSDDDDDDEYDDIIPNALLDNIDPDGAVDRLPELFADKQFWKDSTLWFLLAFLWLLGRFNNPMLNGIVDLDKVDFTQFYDKTGM